MMFIDLEKNYDNVSRAVIWHCLETKRVSSVYIRILQYMNSDVEKCVRTTLGDTQFFLIKVGHHQE